MKSFMIFLYFFMMSSNGMAAWSSGGGELIKDGSNPWFIQNTSLVTYCIVMDQSSVGISESIADAAIQKSIRYWKNEFAHSDNFDPQVKVATQNFRKMDCDPDRGVWADITFQYGFLTQLQRDYLVNVRKYASISVRTDYDRQNLKGKGFIYFAAETGPDSLSDPRFVERPWSRGDNGLLFWTTLHELGHVFGLPHNSGKPSNLRVMSHRFVEHILMKENADSFTIDLSPRQFFSFRPENGNIPEMACSSGQSSYLKIAKKFFGIPEDWDCFGTMLGFSGLEIWAAESWQNMPSPQKIGTVRQVDSFTLVTDAVMFWLPQDQRVFPGEKTVNAPAFRISDVSGEYRSEDNSTVRKVGLTFDPRLDSPLFDDLKISGELDGRFYSNIIEGH